MCFNKANNYLGCEKMEMYVCEKCKEPITHINDLVSCPECGKTYHRWCSLKISNCLGCGCFNKDFASSKVNSALPNTTITNTSGENKSNSVSVPYISTDTGMFSNIGGKMQGLATAVTIIGIIAGIIAFISMAITDEDLIFSGLLTGVAIAFVSWIGSFALYGFGSLILSTQNTERIIREVLKEIKK